MVSDIRYAFRGYRRAPGFTLVALFSLALGIGANTAIFTLVNSILLRTLPVRDPNRLVLFTRSSPDRYIQSQIPLEVFQKLRDANIVMDGFAGAGNTPTTLSGDGFAERVNGQAVSGNYFQALGVSALMGRVFIPDDDRVPGGHPICVIGYGLWTRRFAGARDVIGRSIRINGHAFTILGVTPKGFNGLNQDTPVDITIPAAMANVFAPFAVLLQPFGRLKPGVSLLQAQASLDLLYHQFQNFPLTKTIRVVLEPGGRGLSSLRSQYQTPLNMLMAVAALVLLIACGSFTNLLMARISTRSKDTAVRLALGATRARLMRQFLTENMLLSACGGAFGIALAYMIDRALVPLTPQRAAGSLMIANVTLKINPDWRVLLFTFFVVVFVGALSAAAPGARFTETGFVQGLAGAPRLRAPGRISLANAMVVSQTALSLVVLIGAGLFLRSLLNLKSVDPGFDPNHMVVMTADLPGYSSQASRSFFDRLLQRVDNLPGVVAASAAVSSPLSGPFSTNIITVPGYVSPPNEVWIPDPDSPGRIAFDYIGPDYFKSLGTGLVAGREFNAQDGAPNKVAIVNEKMAAHYWPNESAIGKHIRIDGRITNDSEIVGVVKDLKLQSFRREPKPMFYLPLRQQRGPLLFFTLHVRVKGNTTSVVSALADVIHSLDPSVAPYNVATMGEQIDRSIASDRLMALLMTLFGILAMMMTAVGLYGVMAFTVSARTREIGIRMALGATHSRVFAQVMKESTVLIGSGIALGVLAAMWLSRSIDSFLYGLSLVDPSTYAVVALVLAGVALSAAWIPARRAAQVDPMVALRYE